MRCPNCGYENRDRDAICAHCGESLKTLRARRPAKKRSRGAAPREEAPQAPKKPRSAKEIALRAALYFVCFLIAIFVLGVAVYKVYYWWEPWWQDRLYASGYLRAPEVEEVALDDNRLAHSITFYGKDGGSVFIKELRQSYMLSGGLTRIEIPDSSWFDYNPEDVEAANITLTPILTGENNEKTALRDVAFTVAVPYSPVTLVKPATERQTVNTSVYAIQFQVIKGSTVLVNGEDVTDMIDNDGVVTVNVSVYPQGDNVISLLVSTPYHKQTRKDVVLYRAEQEINLEPSLNTPNKTTRSTLTIEGKMDPGATLVVDTDHVADSVQYDMATGNFSFKAKFETLGNNTVTFRAQMAGKRDSTISLTIYYVPSLAEYSRKAWKMDYAGLKTMFENWKGRVFQCDGVLIDLVPGDPSVVIMDVSEGGQPQLIALENMSSVGTPDLGIKYRAYADVIGQYYYEDQYLSYLSARYMSVYKAN